MAQGRDTISQRISIEGALEVIRALKDMGAAGEKAIAQIQSAVSASTGSTSAIGSVTDAIRGHFAAIHQQLGPVKEKFGELREASNKFGESVNNTAQKVFPHFREVAALAFAGSVAGVVALVKETANYTQEIKKTADELGVSTKKYQELQFAVQASGLEQERFVSTFTRLARSVGEAVIQSRQHFRDFISGVAGDTPITNVILGQVGERAKEAEARLKGPFVAATKEVEEAAQRMQQITEEAFKKAGGNVKRDLPPVQFFIDEIRKAAAGVDTNAAKARTELFRLTGINLPMRTLSEIMDRVKDTTTEMDIKFRELGIQFQNAKGEALPLGDIFEDAATKLNKLGEGEKQFNAQLLFNRGFKEVLPLFSHGGNEIRRLREEFEKLNVAMTDSEIEAGSKLFGAFAKLNIVLENVKSKLILVFSQDIVDIIDAINGAIEHNIQGIIEWARGLREELAPGLTEIILLLNGQLKASQVQTQWVRTLIGVYDTLKEIVNGVSTAFRIFIGFMDRVANVINAAFGTEFTGKQLAVIAIVGQMIGVFGLLAAALSVVVTVGGLLLATVSAPWVLVIAGVTAALVAIAAFSPEIKAVFGEADKWIRDTFGGVWKWFTDGWADAISTIGNGFKRFFDQLTKDITSVLQLFGLATGEAASTGTEGGALGPLARSGGGGIPGSGSGDHVPVLAEPGEYMVRRSAVNQVGLGFMNALNQGLVSRFSLGGIVGALRQTSPEPFRMATGGMVPAMAGGSRGTLNLTIEGRTHRGLTAPAEVMDSLTQQARTSSIISTGKKPKWHGSG